MPEVERTQDVPSNLPEEPTADLFDYYRFHPGTPDGPNKPKDSTEPKPQADSTKPATDTTPGKPPVDGKPAENVPPKPVDEVKPFIPGLPDDKTDKNIPPKELSDKVKEDAKPLNANDAEAPAVLAYRAKQGARRAGGGSAPPVDNNLPVPPTNDRPNQPRPDGPVRPANHTDRPTPPRPGDIRPDVPQPKPAEQVEIKEQYRTNEVDKAIEAAKKSGLPLIVHVGASWCPPCQNMERNVWPGVEKDFKGKAVFLHIDGDDARNLPNGLRQQAAQFTDGVTGYPTIRTYKVEGGEFKQVEAMSGGLGRSTVLQMMTRAGVGDRPANQPRPDGPIIPANHTDVPTPPGPGPRVRPGQPRPEQPRPEQPRPDQPRPEQPRPEQPRPVQPRPEQPRPSDIRPDVPQPKPAEQVEIKEQYRTNEVEKAVEAAKKSGLPLIVHVGASWCPPCQNMDRNVWPGVEKDFAGKAVFLHIDGDDARNLPNGARQAAAQFTNGVTGYPTIRAYKIDGGQLKQVDSRSGGQSRSAVLQMMDRAGVRK